MRLLAKYTNHTGFIDNNLFRFSQPKSLNDFREALPEVLFSGYSDEDWAVAYADAASVGLDGAPRSTIEALFLASCPAHRYDEESFPGLWPMSEPRLRAEPFSKISEFDQAISERVVELYNNYANENFAIFSLSSKLISEPMWAYYGGSHSGLQVRFWQDHLFFRDRSHPVQYSDEPVRVSNQGGMLRICGQRISIEEALDRKIEEAIKSNGFPLAILLRKKIDWQHEEEVRLLRMVSEAVRSDSIDKFGNRVFLFEIPSQAIHSIVIGYDAGKEFIDEIIGKVKSSDRWGNIEIYRRVRGLIGVLEERIL
ncbi:DUF2971 domain-containing protein [Nitrospirillum bahiense]|uniref:DUF2971 family protein n=1 Tax=Nitrospirillum amazonense TaxID=28077 RepID=A0A560FZV0_9PROT|nr:DUF2971 domain-containing protein [Nitrospirillum amazonense]TWB27122.1 DUF2971 family protein [Nitrospirillum amazonense]